MAEKDEAIAEQKARNAESKSEVTERKRGLYGDFGTSGSSAEERDPDLRPGLFEVTETWIRVRSLPDEDAEELGLLEAGRVVEVTEVVRPEGTSFFRGKIEWTDRQDFHGGRVEGWIPIRSTSGRLRFAQRLQDNHGGDAHIPGSRARYVDFTIRSPMADRNFLNRGAHGDLGNRHLRDSWKRVSSLIETNRNLEDEVERLEQALFVEREKVNGEKVSLEQSWACPIASQSCASLNDTELKFKRLISSLIETKRKLSEEVERLEEDLAAANASNRERLSSCRRCGFWLEFLESGLTAKMVLREAVVVDAETTCRPRSSSS